MRRNSATSIVIVLVLLVAWANAVDPWYEYRTVMKDRQRMDNIKKCILDKIACDTYNQKIKDVMRDYKFNDCANCCGRRRAMAKAMEDDILLTEVDAIDFHNMYSGEQDNI